MDSSLIKKYAGHIMDYAAMVFPGTRLMNDVKEGISDQIKDMIMGKVRLNAYRELVNIHRTTMVTILWQNGLLLTSIIPVWMFHSPLPFYAAYAIVFLYTISKIMSYLPEIKLIFRLKSIHAVVKAVIANSIEIELQKNSMQAIVVRYFGPDMDQLNSEISSELAPEVIAVFVNTVMTLFMSFIAFRLTVIPYLEHMAIR